MMVSKDGQGTHRARSEISEISIIKIGDTQCAVALASNNMSAEISMERVLNVAKKLLTGSHLITAPIHHPNVPSVNMHHAIKVVDEKILDFRQNLSYNWGNFGVFLNV